MIFTKRYYTIGQLAKILTANGIKATPSMLRHYEAVFGYISPFNPKRTGSDKRYYTRQQAEKIFEIFSINNRKTVLTIEGLKMVALGRMTVIFNTRKKETK